MTPDNFQVYVLMLHRGAPCNTCAKVKVLAEETLPMLLVRKQIKGFFIYLYLFYCIFVTTNMIS